MRFYFGGVERANSADKEKVTDAMVDQWLQSGNGRVYLRPEDRHVDLNVLISEVENGVLALQKDVGRVDPPNECQGKSWRRT